MSLGLAKNRCSPIAVDFGVDSLKLLQLVPTDPPQMIAAAAAQMPPESRTNPALRHQYLTDTLRKLLKSGAFKGRRAICSIPAYQTLVQHIEIAKAEHEDLDEQIGLHLRQRLNVDPSRMVVRSFLAGQLVRDGANKQEVICLAASRDAVIRYLETAHRAKLDVVGMHAEHPALVRAFAHLFRRASDTERTTCFIDIGAGSTKVVITHGQQMVFAKTIHAGGDQLTRAVAERDGVDFEEARRRRHAGPAPAAAAPVPPPTTATPDPDADDEPVTPAPDAARRHTAGAGGLAIIEAQIAAERRTAPVAVAPPRPAPVVAPPPTTATSDVVDCLIDELQLCVRYHESIFPGRAIEKLVFLGGESRDLGLCQRIARLLRIGAQAGDPMARIVRVNQATPPLGIDMRQGQPGWAVPTGLCLSEANL